MNISEFVKGTLVYLTNCLFAFVLLFLSFWRPNAGVERLLARRAEEPDRWPDGRVILFLAIAGYELTTYEQLVDRKGPIEASGALVFGISGLPQVALVATVLGYVAFEGIMLLCPWDRPADDKEIRPNERFRCLLAIIIVISAVWLWLVVSLGEYAISLNAVTGGMLWNVEHWAMLMLAMAPFVSTPVLIARNSFLTPNTRGKLYGAALLFVFILAPVLASTLIDQFNPPLQPRLTNVACKIEATGAGTLTALVVNDGGASWGLTKTDLLIEFFDPRHAELSDIEPVLGESLMFDEPVPVKDGIYVTGHAHVPLRLSFVGIDASRFTSSPIACLLTNKSGPTDQSGVPSPAIQNSLVWARTRADFDRVGHVEVEPAVPPPPPPP